MDEFAEKFVPVGSLVKIVDRRTGRIADRAHVNALRITDLNYLNEVVNRIDRFWNLNPRAAGAIGSTREKVAVGDIGMYMGSLFVADQDIRTRLEIYRVILLEKTVYAVIASCVDLVQTTGVNADEQD